MDDIVRQGFICPFCMVDMGDFPSLQSHVEHSHPEGGNDIAETVVHNVKGLFDKAKRGMKKLDTKIDFSQINPSLPSSVVDIANIATSAVQEKTRSPNNVRPSKYIPHIGITRSLRSEFMSVRNSSVNEMSNRTNMLIIRLDRLINECPSDVSKRKEFEREVVPWISDNECISCPSCALRFGITKRRHHCRLCGRVMCHNCSQFLPFISARKLTNPCVILDDNTDVVVDERTRRQKIRQMTAATTEKMLNLWEGAVNKIHNDGSEVSIGSLLRQDASECLRVCSSCITDLTRREKMMEQQNPPVIVEQYATLDRLVNELSDLAPAYTRMASSINNGETMYTLKSADEMKQRLAEKQKEVSSLSDKIGKDGEIKGGKEADLRRNVRLVAFTTLQNLLLSLPSLPTAEQYEILVEKHKAEISKQIEEARERNMNEKISVKPSASMPVLNSTKYSTSGGISSRQRIRDEGWTPMQSRSNNPFMEQNDLEHPLYEQLNNIKGYLDQAVRCGRMEEAEILERNVEDLRKEMRNAGLELRE